MMPSDRIAQSTGNGIRVSTVRLPCMHHGGQYETLVHHEGSWDEIDLVRYHTAGEALRGHEHFARLYTATRWVRWWYRLRCFFGRGAL